MDSQQHKPSKTEDNSQANILSNLAKRCKTCTEPFVLEDHPQSRKFSDRYYCSAKCANNDIGNRSLRSFKYT